MPTNQLTGGEFARMLAATAGPLRGASPAPENDETARRPRPGEFKPASAEAQTRMSRGCVG